MCPFKDHQQQQLPPFQDQLTKATPFSGPTDRWYPNSRTICSKSYPLFKTIITGPPYKMAWQIVSNPALQQLMTMNKIKKNTLQQPNTTQTLQEAQAQNTSQWPNAIMQILQKAATKRSSLSNIKKPVMLITDYHTLLQIFMWWVRQQAVRPTTSH